MAEQKVKEILPASPFRVGGRLAIDMGEEEFVELGLHELIKNNIINRRMQPVSIWSLVGPIGIGRTWTMAWLARQARHENMNQTDENWDAALIPGLGNDASVRVLLQSIFSSTEHLREDVADYLEEQEEDEDVWRDDVTEDPVREYVEYAVEDRNTWSVFTGTKSRFPDIPGVAQKPKWTKREVQLEALSVWFDLLEDVGLDHLLVLIDEFEILATNLSKNKLVELSDGLRSFFDIIESRSDTMPNVQVILSLTTEGAANVEPTYGSEGIAGWVRPLQDRMNPPIAFEKMNAEEGKKIAKNVIGQKRKGDFEDPYHPYTESSVVRAAEASDGLTRKFSRVLNEMHQRGYEDNVLDEELADEAIEALGLGEEELYI